MRVFVDTSAFLAVLNPGDVNHQRATAIWESLLLREELLIVTNYVLLETIALAQRRHGIPLVQNFELLAVPVLSIHWVDASTHALGVAALIATNRRQLSLVDCTSFQVMLQLESVAEIGVWGAYRSFGGVFARAWAGALPA